MSKVLFVSRRCGSPHGKVHTSVTFRDAVVPDNCMLSWEEHFYGPYSNVTRPMLLFYNGAKIYINPSPQHADGSITVTVRIEASTGAALEDAIEVAIERIGGVVAEIDSPLAESFVRGVRNDMRSLKQWFLSTLGRMLSAIGRQLRAFADRRLERMRT